MANKKYYIVWSGCHPGVYETWAECQVETKHFSKPIFKSFEGITREEAEQLFQAGPPKTPTRDKAAPSKPRPRKNPNHPDIIRSALSVDAGTKGNPGPMEYRGVWVETGDILFSSKVYPLGTNNIGEFLAIVHAMAWMQQHNYYVPIYSDSRTAMGWIRKCKHNSKLPLTQETQELYNVLERANHWLLNNDLTPYTLLKWETKIWGEIPADYGRK